MTDNQNSNDRGMSFDVDIDSMQWEVESESDLKSDSCADSTKVCSEDFNDASHDSSDNNRPYDFAESNKQGESSDNAAYISLNKHIFVWVFTFLVGSLGVDRFMRGQTGMGIVKLLTGGALGIWSLVDFIVAVTKAYGSSYGSSENIEFDRFGNYTK